MARIKVENTIGIYEVDGKETGLGPDTEMKVLAHWNTVSWVVLKTPDGRTYTVVGSDLEAAIRNAMNSGGP